VEWRCDEGKLPFGKITKPMLVDAIKNWSRAMPAGVPGMPSAEGARNILEYGVRLPLKLETPLAAERFLDLRWIAEVKKELEQKGAAR